MTDDSIDEHFLRRALDVARQGMGLASPGPYVGAVIANAQGNIAGTGAYTYNGVKHAEVLALQQAGTEARGGTLYINLEPHSHRARTPPCTDALIAAGIRRVVASMADPNPKVSGRGFEKLRAAGITVEVGLLQGEARSLNENFARYIRHGVPLVTLKTAMTLNGKIAPARRMNSNRAAGSPRTDWITGEKARANVQQQRHQSDAIMVGIGTVLADDPLLTDRSGCPRRRPLLRVILDSHLRLPLESRLVKSLAAGATTASDVLIFCVLPDEEKKLALESCGIRVEQVPALRDGRPDIQAVLRRLGKLEITGVMIEGGSELNARALATGAVDKIFFYYAPTILEGEAVPFASSAPFGQLNEGLKDEGLKVKQLQFHRFGEDFAVEGYLRDPYEE